MEWSALQGLRYDPTDLGCQCVNIVFGQWTDVPGTSSAIVKYQSNGADESEGGSPPYANAGKAESPGSAGYGAVPEGMNRIELGFNSLAGGYATRAACVAECDSAAARLGSFFGSTATVDLTVLQPDPTQITSLSGAVSLTSKRRAVLGQLTCPVNGSCAITAPATVRVKIAGKRYTLTVNAPTLVAGGGVEDVTVVFPRAGADALRGRKVSVSINVSTTNGGLTQVDGVIKRQVRRNT